MKLISSLIILILLLTIQAFGQLPGHGGRAAIGPPLFQGLIPVDSAVKTGVLSNGLRYYIRRNTEPRNRAELRLVVHAGSIEEDSDQLGMAHFVEHMCFKGTAHFQKDELISFMERAGLKFGADLNASTSFDQTVYQLSLPTDSTRLNNNRETIFKRGFQVLEDWAHLVNFNDKDIDNERNVVTEEWRLGRGASARMRDTYFPVILQGSRYASRVPIGTKESIKSSSYAAIKRFYRDWYRPDLMAVVAVGDFDVAKVETMIRTHFAKLKNPANERLHVDYKIAPNTSPLIAVVTDKEQPYNIAVLYYKQPKAADRVLADLRSATCRELFNAMLNARILEHLQQSNPPFLYGAASYGKFIGNLDAFQCIGVAKSGETISSTIESLLGDNQRAAKFGFQAAELARAKKTLLASLEKQFEEQDKTNSRAYIDEYIDNFIYGGSIPSAKFSYAFARRNMPGITLKELNGLAAGFTGRENRMAVVMAPAKETGKLPDAAALLAVMNKTDQSLTAYSDDASDKPLMPIPPLPGKILDEHLNAAIGLTEIHLQNGIRVLLKPTAFKNNQILLSAFSAGGTSVYPESNYQNASFAADIAETSGLADFSAIQLEKSLAGRTVSVSPFIDEYQQGIRGSSSKEDFETALQLMHLYLTHPRRDTAAFRSFVVRETGSVINSSLDPGSVFADSVNAIMSGNNKRKLQPTVADIQSLKLDAALDAYKGRFSDISAMTVVLVGNLDLKKIRPLLELYLGSLTSAGGKQTWKDDLHDYPAGVQEKVINRGAEPKSQVRIFYTGTRRYTPEINVQLDLLLSAMDIKLRESLRQDLGGTYGVSIYGAVTKIPRERYRIALSFGCAPENAGRLTKAALDVISVVRLKGISAADLEKVKAGNRRSYEVDLRENAYWLQQISQRSFYEENLSTIPAEEKISAGMTTEDTRRLAGEFFNDSSRVTISLMPQK